MVLHTAYGINSKYIACSRLESHSVVFQNSNNNQTPAKPYVYRADIHIVINIFFIVLFFVPKGLLRFMK